VVDTLARTMKGAKEDETGFGNFIANCEIITGEFGGLAIAVHHSGKDASKGLRGWSGLGAALENEWRFVRLANGRRQVVVDKVRDGEDGIGWEFEIQGVELGLNKHGRPMTTCVVNLLSEPAHVEDKAESGGGGGARRDTARSLRDFDDAFNEAMIVHAKPIWLEGAGAISAAIKAVDLGLVRKEFSKRRAVAPDDDEDITDPKAQKRRRSKAISQAFRDIVNKLPRQYNTEFQGDIQYIWRPQ
jgi:hypothetical protein